MSANEHGHAFDHFIIQAARQGLITIPWYCQPPFTDDKRKILRRFNAEPKPTDYRYHSPYARRKISATLK